MATSKTLGGDRLGSGKNMKVKLHGFERSSHDLGRIWRSTMSVGTLVPFLVEYGLPGDKFNINIDADVKTYPTLGPLFGSFKLQLDVFQAPLRLYNAQLHNNALGIGMNMSQIKLPEMEFKWVSDNEQFYEHQLPYTGRHINPSSLQAYLGIRGLGTSYDVDGEMTAKYNAIPLLAYWDIYKNYYANKQEEIGYVIHGENITADKVVVSFGDRTTIELPFIKEGSGYADWSNRTEWILNKDKQVKSFYIKGSNVENENIKMKVSSGFSPMSKTNWNIEKKFDGLLYTKIGNLAVLNDYLGMSINGVDYSKGEIVLNQFALENIDTIRENILQQHKSSSFVINEDTRAPYGLQFRKISINHKEEELQTLATFFSQEGLGIKTYQSDIFNNWLSTEWIDGANGIGEITSIDTSDGSFKIDTLNLANKVYDMLNRIAVSGGSYDDWISANWDHESYRRTESPIYHGGLSKEVIFQEVVGNSASEVNKDGIQEIEPLGKLAGKGGLSNKKKGGNVTIKIHEPSVIIGIVSLTPRVDYSQGNEWHINLKTMDDFHKPGLDQIGFQELITEQMAEWEVHRNNEHYEPEVRYSAGKQPAWINYMTSYNRCYGNFADPDKEMYMTLNRRYEYDEQTKRIKDLTSYIDPSKFNYLFYQQELSSQNFWTQIGMDITARRKMSAKIMPNL